MICPSWQALRKVTSVTWHRSDVRLQVAALTRSVFIYDYLSCKRLLDFSFGPDPCGIVRNVFRRRWKICFCRFRGVRECAGCVFNSGLQTFATFIHPTPPKIDAHLFISQHQRVLQHCAFIFINNMQIILLQSCTKLNFTNVFCLFSSGVCFRMVRSLWII